ncbi:MAG: hypothetical protein HWQ35_22720 [Nostoc sp. NMS1]|uniref:hypothetical protein n=1 Tax=Nostoc sp. NMS1 TaxID=2815388 RepID=UPI0025DA44D0|nr:hypothetical protein [Nostoc sp. NMS1]MBN3909266.1 hypothetical protein [Nostoc sp. NMS1]
MSALNLGRVRTPIPQENLGCFFICQSLKLTSMHGYDPLLTIYIPHTSFVANLWRLLDLVQNTRFFRLSQNISE